MSLEKATLGAKRLADSPDGYKASNQTVVEKMLILSSLAAQLQDARTHQLQLLKQLTELEEAAIRDQEFERKRALYRRHTLANGFTVLRLAKPQENPELFLSVCPHCAESRHEFHPLHPFGSGLACSACDATFVTA
ncbi:hypothetical protein ACFQ4E_06070 [Litorisediminicola beolgyonensis]|uniref:Uncharacterized protein n=2 Tax=Litorisediminicola beolgyonensis TaxID=1173614 RepID=A0ABW3ZGK9_9RHOB